MPDPPTLDPVLRLALRGGLAVLFLWAGVHKIVDPGAFRRALSGYALLPGRVVPWAAAAFPVVELAIALGLLWPGAGAAPALGAGLLLAVYSAAIAINLARGRRDIDCGCLGTAGRSRLGAGLLWRNGLLLTVAALAAAPGGGRDLGVLDALSVVAAVATAVLLYAAADGVLSLSSAARRTRGRAEA